MDSLERKPAPAPLARFTGFPPPGEEFYRYPWPGGFSRRSTNSFFADPPPSGGGPRLWMYGVSTGESAASRICSCLCSTSSKHELARRIAGFVDLTHAAGAQGAENLVGAHARAGSQAMRFSD